MGLMLVGKRRGTARPVETVTLVIPTNFSAIAETPGVVQG
jgi:hypothetical protein